MNTLHKNEKGKKRYRDQAVTFGSVAKRISGSAAFWNSAIVIQFFSLRVVATLDKRLTANISVVVTN